MALGCCRLNCVRVSLNGLRVGCTSEMSASTLVTAGREGTLKVWNLDYIRRELRAIGLGW
jgi:hypothetical protein